MKLSQKLVVNVQAGEEPPNMSHHSHTRSGKIRAMTEPEPEPDKDYQEARTNNQTFTNLHQ